MLLASTYQEVLNNLSATARRATIRPELTPPEEVCLAFAENLRRARIQRFWTQAALSQASGISVITIARLEAGKHTPSVRTVLALAKALGVEPASLADPEELAAEREKEAA